MGWIKTLTHITDGVFIGYLEAERGGGGGWPLRSVVWSGRKPIWNINTR